MVDWVLGAVEDISNETVVKSFKVTGLSPALDESENHMINNNILVHSQ